MIIIIYTTVSILSPKNDIHRNTFRWTRPLTSGSDRERPSPPKGVPEYIILTPLKMETCY